MLLGGWPQGLTIQRLDLAQGWLLAQIVCWVDACSVNQYVVISIIIGLVFFVVLVIPDRVGVARHDVHWYFDMLQEFLLVFGSACSFVRPIDTL